MRLFLRAGIVLGLAVAACGKDSPSPVDFNDPAAVSADLSSVDSAFDSDVFRSFNTTAAFYLQDAQPTTGATAFLIRALRPSLERSGAQVFLPGLRQADKLRMMIPNLIVSAAQGRIIPDSMYGRQFVWDTAANRYTRDTTTTVSGLDGVRFVLYALGLDGEIFEPVSAIGTLDVIDQSTPSLLQLQVLVKNSAGTTTYLDYTASLVASTTSATATVTGSITNGLSDTNNKTLTFNETVTVNDGGAASVHATFELNNPAITLTLNESQRFTNPNFIIDADFTIESTETIRVVGRVTINPVSGDIDVSIGVFVEGHPVASINGDPTNPATQWVDAGGEPLTVADLAALEGLFDALENMHNAVNGLFAPVASFTGLQ